RRNGNTEIYARNLDTNEERRIDSPPGGFDLKPAVAGGIIVWQACTSLGICDIWAHDWASRTSRAITSTPSGDERFADIDDGRVVYDGLRDGDRDIYLFDLRTGEELRLELPGEQIYPNISGDFVAFEELAGEGYHIRLWHLPSGAVFDVTGSEGYQFLNDIDGNRIVYTDDRNGHLDIYMFEFELTLPPASVVDCASAAETEPLVDVVFRRTTGRPNEYSVPFSAAAGPGLVCVENPAEGAPRVTSATLTLNQASLLLPGDLKDEEENILPAIELRPTLQASNLLEARMAGKPGSALRVRVYALEAASPTALPKASPIRADSTSPGIAAHSGTALRPRAVMSLGAASEVAVAGLVDETNGVRRPQEEKRPAASALVPMPGYGCSQSGPGALAPAALIAALLALLVRPSRCLARTPRRRSIF
ncbi:MAG TPA: hypothetical protein DFS52_00810, partial [Myxococcales bacterium]|nr:hypothetical protein [Myxococcales bacterium]